MFGHRRSVGDRASSPGPSAPPSTPGVGPYDEADAPDLGLPEWDWPPLVDYGALRVAVPDGVTVEIEPAPGAPDVQELVLRADRLTVRMAVFAAPKSRGTWDGFRADLAAAIAGTDAPSAANVPSAANAPSAANVPNVPNVPSAANVPSVTAAPASATPVVTPTVTSGRYGPEFSSGGTRLIGISGPRWYLRIVTTPAGEGEVGKGEAVDTGAGTGARTALPVLDEILRGTVVVRGAGAMPAGAALPLGHRQPTGSRRVALTDLWTDEPTTAGTGTLERRRDVYESTGVFTGSLSRNLSTWG
ncbi:DUF3710 domain-containing protein [Parafrankia sp. EUN1f]|uniref:DUF3710 domain-containing protein n=1 Tax=Parafrankia sp. EUN1f TaxID=102897 RepID=UPI0001C44684|nr:DUF3710 domain-containing protein [Parafrankia sp. EUN1f]EFC85022.1 hypothetical protein FrEUN1fDRAFT_1808 [Parafrankia sp. EUN1f]